MSLIDVGAVCLIGLSALSGFRRGLVVGLCSLAGLAVGAYLGAKLAPDVVRGRAAVYPPLVTLVGAVVGAGIGQALAVLGGRSVRQLLSIGLLRAVDNVGGAVLGGLSGVVLVWAVASVLLYTPGDTGLRRDVQQSSIARRLTGAFPPSRVIDVLARIDPFRELAGPAADVAPGDPALLRDRGVLVARRSVLRVIGNACGLGIEGSGWIARPGLVVTNAHVVAGVEHPLVDRHDGRLRPASVVVFDAHDDLAVLRVPGLRGRPLRLAPPESHAAVAVLGYPEDGPLLSVPGRLGETVTTLAHDAYGHFPVARTVTTIRAKIRPGNSGGPAVDGLGRVRAVVFARRAGDGGGFGVPVDLVERALAAASGAAPVSSACAEG